MPNDVLLSEILVLSIHYLLKDILSLDFMNKTVVTIHVQVFLWTDAFSSLVKTRDVAAGS